MWLLFSGMVGAVYRVSKNTFAVFGVVLSIVTIALLYIASEADQHHPAVRSINNNAIELMLLPTGTQGNRRVAALKEDWIFCDEATSEVHLVFKGFRTDFASIPGGAQSFISPFGAHAEAAVIHDFMYAVGEEGGRDQADKVFYTQLRESRVGALRSRIMYEAVRRGGGGAYGRQGEWRFVDTDRGINLPSFCSPKKPDTTIITNVTNGCSATMNFGLSHLADDSGGEVFGTHLDNLSSEKIWKEAYERPECTAYIQNYDEHKLAIILAETYFVALAEFAASWEREVKVKPSERDEEWLGRWLEAMELIDAQKVVAFESIASTEELNNSLSMFYQCDTLVRPHPA